MARRALFTLTLKFVGRFFPLSSMPIYVPPQVGLECLGENRRRMGSIYGHVVLKAVLADVLQQRLQPRHLHFATPFSSPKLGNATRMPSISSALALNKAAHFWASSHVLTPPRLVSSSASMTNSIPISSKTARISCLASVTKAAGKKSRIGPICFLHLNKSFGGETIGDQRVDQSAVQSATDRGELARPAGNTDDTLDAS